MGLFNSFFLNDNFTFSEKKKSYLASHTLFECLDFPGGLLIKTLHANAGDKGLIPGSGRFPGEGNDNPL